jgi:putative hydrolase of the HAD superfamily
MTKTGGETAGADGRGPTVIGFDADDTLWHTEAAFREAEAVFLASMRAHAAPDAARRRLERAERRNLAIYGFGVKSFVLSMIETALDLSGGRVEGATVARLIDIGRAMLSQPVELMPHAAATVERLARDRRLILITKGDLIDQRRKLAMSGLADAFAAVEIVPHKDTPTYIRAFAAHGQGAHRAVMVGDSMRSDVLPALAAGARAVHVPAGAVWALERAEAPRGHPRLATIRALDALPALVDAMG